jgi:hypothetical protein
MRSGRSAAWLARLVRDQEVDGSNPFAPTILFTEVLRGRRSGFRLRAQTPAKRLKFKSIRPDHFSITSISIFTVSVGLQNASR